MPRKFTARLSGPDPIDIAVGARLRQRRVDVRLSQTVLASALGITFQQVQKYEKGTNRMAASTLFRAAGALGVAVSYFFEGIDSGTSVARPPPLPDRRAVAAAWTFSRIEDPAVRKAVHNLIQAIAVPAPEHGNEQ